MSAAIVPSVVPASPERETAAVVSDGSVALVVNTHSVTTVAVRDAEKRLVTEMANRYARRNIVAALLPEAIVNIKTRSKLSKADAQSACLANDASVVKAALDGTGRDKQAARVILSRGSAMLSARQAVKLFLATCAEDDATGLASDK